MYKIDLHTHSAASPDGALTAKDYENAFAGGKLDTIAVTDHDTITFALELNRHLGDKIIVGEEITTSEGEIIGLFLSEAIPPGLSPEDTIRHIRRQGGLVYIPHPFETVRRGLQPAVLDRIAAEVDIVEIYNGRAYFQNKSAAARRWAETHRKPGTASSDAHGVRGWNRTYTTVPELPTKENLVNMLNDGIYSLRRVGFGGMLYPKFNRLKKRSGHGA